MKIVKSGEVVAELHDTLKDFAGDDEFDLPEAQKK